MYDDGAGVHFYCQWKFFRSFCGFVSLFHKTVVAVAVAVAVAVITSSHLQVEFISLLALFGWFFERGEKTQFDYNLLTEFLLGKSLPHKFTRTHSYLHIHTNCRLVVLFIQVNHTNEIRWIWAFFICFWNFPLCLSSYHKIKFWARIFFQTFACEKKTKLIFLVGN